MATKGAYRSRLEAVTDPVVTDLVCISSGTISGLIGDNRYDVIEVVWENFRLWTIHMIVAGWRFDSWIDAWLKYATPPGR